MDKENWFYQWFQPAGPQAIPYARAAKITLRTLHLMATNFLFGGHVFGASLEQLRPLMYATIVTGGGMIALEAYPSLGFLFEGWGVLLLGKLALLCLIPWLPGYRIWILLAVVALAAVGSHMPARFRHYSLLYRRVIKQ